MGKVLHVILGLFRKHVPETWQNLRKKMWCHWRLYYPLVFASWASLLQQHFGKVLVGRGENNAYDHVVCSEIWADVTVCSGLNLGFSTSEFTCPNTCLAFFLACVCVLGNIYNNWVDSVMVRSWISCSLACHHIISSYPWLILFIMLLLYQSEACKQFVPIDDNLHSIHIYRNL